MCNYISPARTRFLYTYAWTKRPTFSSKQIIASSITHAFRSKQITNDCIFISIALNISPKRPLGKRLVLGQVMAYRRTGDNPLGEFMNNFILTIWPKPNGITVPNVLVTVTQTNLGHNAISIVLFVMAAWWHSGTYVTPQYALVHPTDNAHEGKVLLIKCDIIL